MSLSTDGRALVGRSAAARAKLLRASRTSAEHHWMLAHPEVPQVAASIPLISTEFHVLGELNQRFSVETLHRAESFLHYRQRRLPAAWFAAASESSSIILAASSRLSFASAAWLFPERRIRPTRPRETAR
jgi:hypothetical protein